MRTGSVNNSLHETIICWLKGLLSLAPGPNTGQKSIQTRLCSTAAFHVAECGGHRTAPLSTSRLAFGYSDLMKCGCVLPNLFVGPAPTDEADFKQLRLMKITAILSLQTEEDVVTGLETCRRAASKRGLTFHNVPVVDFDRADLQRKLRDCVELLKNLLENGDVVYLHCTAGVSRSPTVAAAFLHWKQGWTLDEAITHLLTVRNCCPDTEIIRNQ